MRISIVLTVQSFIQSEWIIIFTLSKSSTENITTANKESCLNGETKQTLHQAWQNLYSVSTCIDLENLIPPSIQCQYLRPPPPKARAAAFPYLAPLAFHPSSLSSDYTLIPAHWVYTARSNFPSLSKGSWGIEDWNQFRPAPVEVFFPPRG